MRNTGFFELLSFAKERERLEGLGDSWQGLSDLDEATVPTCILLQSFGPKHPLNVYRAKSDKNFLLPVYYMTPGSHTFGDSRELSFPLLLFHFGNAG